MKILLLAFPIALGLAQAGDRSMPPRAAEGTGGFTIRRLAEAPVIDGRTWIETHDQVMTTGTSRAPNGQFTLIMEDAPDRGGDVARFAIYFSDGRAPRVLLDPDVAYTYISPDSRWIISEPLEAIDVTTWIKYSLSKAFNIEPYVVMRAISPDRRRLYISRQACPFDCRHIPDEHYEIRFP